METRYVLKQLLNKNGHVFGHKNTQVQSFFQTCSLDMTASDMKSLMAGAQAEN